MELLLEHSTNGNFSPLSQNPAVGAESKLQGRKSIPERLLKTGSNPKEACEHPPRYFLKSGFENNPFLIFRICHYVTFCPKQNANARRCRFRCALVVSNWEHGLAEVGYALSTLYQSRGLMTDAVNQLLGDLFANTLLERVEARCAIENTGSQRVLEKNGFLREGLLKATSSFMSG